MLQNDIPATRRKRFSLIFPPIRFIPFFPGELLLNSQRSLPRPRTSVGIRWIESFCHCIEPREDFRWHRFCLLKYFNAAPATHCNVRICWPSRKGMIFYRKPNSWNEKTITMMMVSLILECTNFAQRGFSSGSSARCVCISSWKRNRQNVQSQ